MIRIYYFAPGRELWFNVVYRLHKEGIATPILWIGDHRHDDKFSEAIGTCEVISLSLFTDIKDNIAINPYEVIGANFLFSDRYLVAKDRSIKMMDRLDIDGRFSRVDREAIFNRICLYALSKIQKDLPNALVMGESPHSYVQYIFYEVCRFYGVPSVSFGSWSIAPALYLQDEETREVISKNGDVRNSSDDTMQLIERLIDNYVNEVVNASSEYAPDYMVQQKKFSRFKNVTNRLGKEPLLTLKKKAYLIAKDPRSYLLSQRRKIYAESKRLILFKKSSFYSKMPDFKEPYVYFPLHYEPERTTNPDGVKFHDQTLALATLREFLPGEIKIYVKEHPSQFFSRMQGHKGRSQYFYDCLCEMKNVDLVEMDTPSVKLIDGSVFVATITGTAALEGAIRQKKSLIFGKAWFAGCPNVYQWENVSNVNDIMGSGKASASEVKTYLVDQYKKYCVPGYQNPSGDRRWRTVVNHRFFEVEEDSVYKLLKNFLESQRHAVGT